MFRGVPFEDNNQVPNQQNQPYQDNLNNGYSGGVNPNYNNQYYNQRGYRGQSNQTYNNQQYYQQQNGFGYNGYNSNSNPYNNPYNNINPYNNPYNNQYQNNPYRKPGLFERFRMRRAMRYNNPNNYNNPYNNYNNRPGLFRRIREKFVYQPGPSRPINLGFLGKAIPIGAGLVVLYCMRDSLLLPLFIATAIITYIVTHLHSRKLMFLLLGLVGVYILYRFMH